MCAPVINRQIGFAGWARVGARSAGLYLTCTRVHLRATTYLHLYKRRYDTRLAELDELSSPLLSSCGAEGPANNESRDFTASRSATAKMPRNSGFEPLRRAREGEEATLSLSLSVSHKGTASDETLIAVSLGSRVVLDFSADSESNRNS